MSASTTSLSITSVSPAAAESSARKRVTVPDLLAAKGEKKLVALTAYDYTMARLVDESGVDFILVGDSAACVMQGHSNTLPATLEQMIYHSACVVRGTASALVVGDLPFLSYQVSIEKAIESAGRMLKEAGVSAVKLEGGVSMAPTIEALVRCDIPVMAHIGLTPQSYHRMGGHKIQGKKKTNHGVQGREQVLKDALAVEAAGAFAVVLEGIPGSLANEITAAVSIPTIGIGAGTECDGQILVTHDMLGMHRGHYPSFVKKYADLAEVIGSALTQYNQEVRTGQFPRPAAAKALASNG